MKPQSDDWANHQLAIDLQHSAPGLGYADAVTRAAAVKRAEFREKAPLTADHAIDQVATELQARQGISYWDALQQAAAAAPARQVSSFAEPGLAVAALEGQPIEIFKAGRHTDDSGQVREFTPADVSAIAMAYSPRIREAPLTLGHPESDRPAYGWVSQLRATADGVLTMRAERVEAKFAEMVKAGRYSKRSVSFYPPNHPSNPRPGSWYLRHVAWLGAQQPAVPGLRNVAFGDPDGCSAFTLG